MMGNADIDLDAIYNFVGYGCPEAPIVFVGIEERLSDVNQRLQSLVVRSAFEPIMDVAVAHAAGLAHDPRLFDQENAVCQRTWRPMCDLLLRYEFPGNTPNRTSRNQYQANTLGRVGGNSLLMELLPYPHATARDWWYADLHPEWVDRIAYEAAMLPQRIALLSLQMAQHPRALIVCYGASHWIAYKDLIQGFRQHVDPGHAAAPINWDLHPALSAESRCVGETRIVLVNHFTRPPLSTEAALGPFSNLCFPGQVRQ
jgi:hypothetical protein